MVEKINGRNDREYYEPLYVNSGNYAVRVPSYTEVTGMYNLFSEKINAIIDELNELKKEIDDGRQDVREDEDRNKTLC